jgi:UDP-glucuronate 4-epimerase
MDYIAAIEKALGKKANLEMLPLQPGGVPSTHADLDDLVRQFDYKPATSVDQGFANFVNWYRNYYET